MCYSGIIPAAEKRVVNLSLNMLIFFLSHVAFHPITREHLSIIPVFTLAVLCGGRKLEGHVKHRVRGDFGSITGATSGWPRSF